MSSSLASSNLSCDQRPRQSSSRARWSDTGLLIQQIAQTNGVLGTRYSQNRLVIDWAVQWLASY